MVITFNFIKKRIKKTLKLYQEAIQLSKNAMFMDIDVIVQELNTSKTFRSDQNITEIKHLINLVETKKAKTMLEIGSSKGGTLFLLSRVAPQDALIISLDIDYPLERRLAHAHFARDRQKIICLEQNSQTQAALKKVQKILRGRELDFLFIDGDHRFFGVMSDYVLYSPIVREGGIIGLHDIQPDSHLRYGIKTSNYVGEVPIFWSALVQSGLKTDQIIEDPEQDGRGIGFIFKE